MSFVLGLTGSIASGKSTVSQYFKQLGFPVVDADVASREVVKPGKPGLQEIVQTFGVDYLNEDGTLNRKKLGQLIFNDAQARLQLNAILHDEIYQWIQKEKEAYIAQNQALIILDIPLLYETDRYVSECNAVMVVHVSPQTQLDRLMTRDGLDQAEAMNRISSQVSIDTKAERADIVIDNSGSRAHTYDQVREWVTKQGLYVLKDND